uniref:FecR family protein n=1 Tax=uncultured Draconibacterium sp. TaxID=1573823 RepID=UPI0032176BCB
MHEKNTIHTTIIRLFSGEATPDEKSKVGAWLKQSDNNRKLYADLQEIWLATGVPGNRDNYNTEVAVKVFKERIQNTGNKGKVFRLKEILKYAAIVVLLVSLPIVYYFGKTNSNFNETYTTITCAFGDKSTITLPDGSFVHLNSGSKLIFNNNFHSEARMVSLEGEAYFSVKKNKNIPFKVKASDIEIEVLGTEFNLKAYPDENTISTTLAEGSVQIKSKSQQALMEPGQKIVYNRVDNEMKLFELKDITPETEWKEGRLVFRNESLEELELKLERWFDVDIEFADELVKKRKFTGILERESILEAITYFSFSKHVGYKIKDNEITFYSK